MLVGVHRSVRVYRVLLLLAAYVLISEAACVKRPAGPRKPPPEIKAPAPEPTATPAPEKKTGKTFRGTASFYARSLEGRPTSSGEPLDGSDLTAAHRTLPFGTRLRVTNTANGKSVVVTVNDRGPFVAGRVLDLSRRAAERLDFVADGTATVEAEILK